MASHIPEVVSNTLALDFLQTKLPVEKKASESLNE